MWGGGFLRQASETSKQNHDLLRKTRDKAKGLTNLTGAHGHHVDTKQMTEEERRKFIIELKAENKRDFQKKVIVLTVVTLVLLLIGLLIFN